MAASATAMQAELDRLKKENEELRKKAEAKNKITLKVSEKGAISIYGLGRFPVTLYKEQMLRLLGIVDEIKAFMAANDAKLTTKQ